MVIFSCTYPNLIPVLFQLFYKNICSITGIGTIKFWMLKRTCHISTWIDITAYIRQYKNKKATEWKNPLGCFWSGWEDLNLRCPMAHDRRATAAACSTRTPVSAFTTAANGLFCCLWHSGRTTAPHCSQYPCTPFYLQDSREWAVLLPSAPVESPWTPMGFCDAGGSIHSK